MPVEDATELALAASRRIEGLGIEKLRIVTQEQFLREAAKQPALSFEERVAILDQAELVLRNLYAHLKFKKNRGVEQNPFEGIRLIREQIETLSDFDFHTCMLLALATMRDVHTAYVAPSPYRGAVAFLPFQMRFFEMRRGQFRFVVAKRMEFEHEHFREGAEVIAWNDISAIDATFVAAQMQPGANQDAELSRGTARMTLRSIASHGVAGEGGVPPFVPQNTAKITYIAPGEKKKREIRFPWQVATGLGGRSFSSTAFSVSDSMSVLQRWGKCSYHPQKVQAAVAAAAASESEDDFLEAQFATDPPRPGMPDPALLANSREPGLPFGYLRIRNFASDAPSLLEDAKFAQVKALLERFDREAPGGLILDIRGNPGGQIRLAERMLQLLTPRRIEPLRFHFPRTPVVEEVIQILRTTPAPAGEFAAWLEPQPGDEETDANLTPGRAITPVDLANDTGQVYQGPVVLLFDALTYSAADMFAAGFQDHNIGELIGVDCSTGGGGANAWSYTDILDNLPAIPGLNLKSLPRDCELHVAVRRCLRTGPEPVPIEDIGVAPNFMHARTERDIFGGNADLFAFACDRLSQAPIARIDIDKAEPGDLGFEVVLRALGVGHILFHADDTIIAREGIADSATFHLEVPLVASELRLEGYASEDEVAQGLTPIVVRRIPLQTESKSNLEFLRVPPSKRRRPGQGGEAGS